MQKLDLVCAKGDRHSEDNPKSSIYVFYLQQINRWVIYEDKILDKSIQIHHIIITIKYARICSEKCLAVSNDGQNALF